MDKATYKIITGAYRAAFGGEFDYSYSNLDALNRFQSTVVSELGISEDDADALISKVNFSKGGDLLSKPMDIEEGKSIIKYFKRGVDVNTLSDFTTCKRVRALIRGIR